MSMDDIDHAHETIMAYAENILELKQRLDERCGALLNAISEIHRLGKQIAELEAECDGWQINAEQWTIESAKDLKQQLTAKDAEIARWQNCSVNAAGEVLSRSKERDKLRKQNVMLRDAIEEGLSTYCVPRTARIMEALAATADLKDYILCDAEPVMWRHRHADLPEWRIAEPRNPNVNTVMDTVNEIQQYIDGGYKYELQPLYKARELK